MEHSNANEAHKLRTSLTGETKMVGLVRFELTTSCTPCKRATRLRYSPNKERSQSGTVLTEASVFLRGRADREFLIQPRSTST